MGSIKTILSIVVIGAIFFYLMNAYDLTYTGGVIDQKGLNTRGLLLQQDAIKDQVNVHIQNVPNFIKTMFGDAMVNVQLTMKDGSMVQKKVAMKGGKIATMQDGSFAKADYTVWSSEETIDALLASDKPTKDFAQALLDDKVTIKADSMWNSAKVMIGRAMVHVYVVL